MFQNRCQSLLLIIDRVTVHQVYPFEGNWIGDTGESSAYETEVMPGTLQSSSQSTLVAWAAHPSSGWLSGK